jgi:hypothetical protein
MGTSGQRSYVYVRRLLEMAILLLHLCKPPPPFGPSSPAIRSMLGNIGFACRFIFELHVVIQNSARYPLPVFFVDVKRDLQPDYPVRAQHRVGGYDPVQNPSWNASTHL